MELPKVTLEQYKEQLREDPNRQRSSLSSTASHHPNKTYVD